MASERKDEEQTDTPLPDHPLNRDQGAFCLRSMQVTRGTPTYIQYKGYNTVSVTHSAVNVLQLLEAIKELLPNKLGAVDITELSLYPSGFGSPVEPYNHTTLFEDIKDGNSYESPFIVRRKRNQSLPSSSSYAAESNFVRTDTFV